MNKSCRAPAAFSSALLAVLAVCPLPADAQTVRKRPFAEQQMVPPQRGVKDWQEPTSFLSVEIGKPLSGQSSVVVACPGEPVSKLMPDVMIYDHNFKGFCYQGKLTDASTYLTTRNEPQLGVGYQMDLVVKGGVVYGALLRVGRFSRHDFLALLKSRYGEPHSAKVETYRNRVGGTFEGEVYRWEGPTMLLEFSEYAASTDWAGFSILRKDFAEKQDEQRNEKAQQYKGKL